MICAEPLKQVTYYVTKIRGENRGERANEWLGRGGVAPIPSGLKGRTLSAPRSGDRASRGSELSPPPTPCDPGEDEQRSLRVGLRGAADQEFVDALTGQTEFAGEERFRAPLPEQRADRLHELVPERGFRARTQGAVLAGQIFCAASDGFLGRLSGGLPQDKHQLQNAIESGVSSVGHGADKIRRGKRFVTYYVTSSGGVA